MEDYINYLPTLITVFTLPVSLTWFFAKMDKRVCLNNQITKDEFKAVNKKLDSIEKHAKYTNGKVAEVMEWKLKNEDFIEKLK